MGAAQLRDDIYDAFTPLSSLGVSRAATNDAFVTQSVSDLISESQFQSLIFAILASMTFLILYYLIDIRKPFLGVITILPVVVPRGPPYLPVCIPIRQGLPTLPVGTRRIAWVQLISGN